MRGVLERLRTWWGAPVIISRFVLFLVYLTCAAVGFTTWLATNPTLDAAVGDLAAAWWGVCMTASGLACAATVFTIRLEMFEQAASIVLAAMLISFIAAVAQLMQADGPDHLAYLTIAVALSPVPVSRAVWLISRTGRRHG